LQELAANLAIKAKLPKDDISAHLEAFIDAVGAQVESERGEVF
jgi:nucleoid DNA-binding protein